MNADELRNKYLDFFKDRGHKIVPSDSLVPQDDPTLLFTGAGMNQFKQMFLGEVKQDFNRATTCQKCFRTTDIENIGKTARHLTFLEMLGNFSFGDYFKEEVISWAWEFLTKELKIPQDRLWISIFKDDDESFELWQKINVSKERIVRLGEEDNFWDMGPTGPCGPCSEIIFDRGEDTGCGKKTCTAGCDCDRFLELWNLVFMQFNRQEDGTFQPLPQKNIDTGMGLERALSIMEGKDNVFETSLLNPLVESIREVAVEASKVSLRIIADHLRSSVFLISDGVLPANEGRGYVLRRLIRRAVRQGKVSGVEKPFLHSLTSVVVNMMKKAYPDLVSRRQHIAQVVLSEEERFQRTLNQGIEILEGMLEELRKKKKKKIPGELVFKLYDTYGFPLNLTEELAGESGFSVDREGFEKAMRKQQELARTSRSEESLQSADSVYNRLAAQFKQKTKFVGYDTIESETKVLAVLKERELAEEAKTGDKVEIILARTPFYGESGGQVGDTGFIIGDQGLKIKITDTRKPLPEVILHCGKVMRGELKTGDKVTAKVNAERRQNIASNHTATHLLHYALQQVLGEHVTQAGSLVAPGRLRFDFTHFKAPDEQQLARIEELVNDMARENTGTEIMHTTLPEAQKQGAMALFGEKYGAQVRLVKVGNYSRELCGGVHLKSTGEIGLFKIIGESSIASGIRRIEAVTGKEAYLLVKQESETLKELSAKVLKVPVSQITSRVEDFLKKMKSLEKEISKLKSGETTGKAQDLLENVQLVEGIKVIALRQENLNRDELRALLDSLKDKIESGIIVLGTVLDGKATLVAGATKNVVKKGIHAGKVIKEAAEIIGGSGGGREDYAQAGGKDIAKLDKALQEVPKIIARQISS